MGNADKTYDVITVSWIEMVSRSFVGRFGHMSNIGMHNWMENNYIDFIKAGFLLVFLHPLAMFRLKENGKICKMGIFNWCMLIAMIIPNILNAYYSYTSDYQPQGRYSLPMLIPLTYFIVTGYQNLFDPLIKNRKIRNGVYAGICIVLAALVFYVYAGILYTGYSQGPFGLKALIGEIR